MSSDISLENVLRKCGDLGRHQIIHYIFLNLITLGSGITTFYYVFGVAEPAYRCRLPLNIDLDKDEYQSINLLYQNFSNQRQQLSKCNDLNGSICKDFVYDRSIFGRTFTEEGNFICENALKKTWLSTMYQVGGFVALLTGYIGDKVGRRKMIRILTIMLFAVPFFTQILLQTISMNIDMKLILLSINQLFSSIDAYPMVFLLLMELTSSSHTSLAGNSAVIGFTIGESFITLFAYIARDWLRLKWIITAYFGLILPYLYFVPESPYWLFSQKKYNQLEVCLRKIAKTNGRTDDEWYSYYKQLIYNPRLCLLSRKHASRTNKELILYFLPRLSLCAFIGCVTMLLYIKISYGLGAMSDVVSPYSNIIIGAIVEGIGYISASILITTKLGRKYSFIVFTIFTCICVLIIPFIMESHPIITIIISQIGKLTISAAVLITWIYVPEIFPTSIRGVANGIFVFTGRIGAILAPIVDVALGDEYAKITFFIYSILTIFQIVAIYTLPETRNRSFHTDEDEENDLDDQDLFIFGNQPEKPNDTTIRSTPVILKSNKIDVLHTQF
ncbi:unnamed protein product [Rotaria sordida]|uniref:Major facilitator superfamily (MFS) profile domain-containing protein n=1 Tax=Rotaria sordida TaxID=392033 RepID=A0A818USS8_9BILA|nr:unnamed protein product [Rotaria sordida]CAF3699428.1 unnamed protein product [Rotaria sordida]